MHKRDALIVVIICLGSLGVRAQADKAMFDRGLQQSASRQYLEAISSFSAYAKQEPTEAAAPFNIGLCYFALERYRDALPYFEKTIELKPDYANAYLYRANTLDYLGRYN